jgi:hypothetical protein
MLAILQGFTRIFSISEDGGQEAAIFGVQNIAKAGSNASNLKVWSASKAGTAESRRQYHGTETHNAVRHFEHLSQAPVTSVYNSVISYQFAVVIMET